MMKEIWADLHEDMSDNVMTFVYFFICLITVILIVSATYLPSI